ncbi:hypothetical protein TNCV_3004701 [Trichonephila clavipes]|nr:hypothetical protein TNCV_3004701 [Trichonephila clavipes]
MILFPVGKQKPYKGKSVVVLDETKQVLCGYVMVGTGGLRRTDDVVDHFHRSEPLHCLRVPFDAIYSRVVCPQDVSSANGAIKEGYWWQNGMKLSLIDESSICLQHHDGRIRVWREDDEKLRVMHSHTGPAPDIMGHNVTVDGDRYRAMITNFFIPELNNHDVQELWFQQDGATCHTARAKIGLLKDTFMTA